MDLQWISARKMLTCERIDLMAKYTYVEHKERGFNMKWADELYLRHIEAFSGGNFSEPGNENKNSIEAYRETFDELCEVMRNNQFDSNISNIPCSTEFVIGDGAHRVAAAAYFNRELPCSIVDKKMPVYDYAFFLSHYLEPVFCDYMLTKYVEMKKENVYVICIWPRGMVQKESLTKIDGIIREECRVIGYKETKMSYQGLKNFMIQCYANQEWMGGIDTRFRGVEGKVDPCYEKNGKVGVYVVELNNPKTTSIVELKARLRQYFGLENHSLHSSDTVEESIRMVHLLFNQNSLHILNNAKLDYDMDAFNRISQLKQRILQEEKSLERYVIDSSTVMSIYGIRKSRDLDYITVDDCSEDFHLKDIDCHNSALKYYKMDASEIVMNPRNYGYVFDMKIITLPVLMKFKETRGEKKDLDDVKLIKQRISNTQSLKNSLEVHLIQLGRFFRNFRTKIRDILQKHNIYFFTKLWHLIRGKGFK